MQRFSTLENRIADLETENTDLRERVATTKKSRPPREKEKPPASKKHKAESGKATGRAENGPEAEEPASVRSPPKHASPSNIRALPSNRESFSTEDNDAQQLEEFKEIQRIKAHVSDEESDSIELRHQKIPAPSADDRGWDVTDLVPQLHDILRVPLPTGTSETYQIFIELERRHEEALLCYRNLSLAPYIRNGSWIRDDFFSDIECEEAHECFPVKAPNFSEFDMSKIEANLALELGTKRLDDFQWKLMTYELVLLCFSVIERSMQSYELEDIMQRDVMVLKPESYVGSDVFAKEESNPRNFKDPYRAKDDEPILVLEIAFFIIKRIMSLAKVTFGISRSLNTVVHNLTLPNQSGYTRNHTNIHALDIRYRAVLLMESWYNCKCPGAVEGVDDVGTDTRCKEWMLRQLHVLHCALCSKLQRLSKFLPQYKGMYQWLREDLKKGIWYRPILGRLPVFNHRDNANLRNNLWPLLGIAEYCLSIVTGLARAVDQQLWGVDVDRDNCDEVLTSLGIAVDGVDLLRNAESIHMLILGMTAMSKLDSVIRKDIAEYEGADVEEESDTSAEEEKYAISKRDLKKIIDSTSFPIGSFDVYWAMELPILMTLMSYLWRVSLDSGSQNKLRHEAQELVQGFFLVGHMAQHGMDVSQIDEVPTSMGLISYETYCVISVQTLWYATLELPEAVDITALDMDDNPTAAKANKKFRPLSADLMKSMYVISKSFPKWVAQVSDAKELEDNSQGEDYKSPAALLMDRIIDNTPMDSYESLIQKPRVDFRVPHDDRKYRPEDEYRYLYKSHTDPDWFVVDINDFNVVNKDGNIYTAIETIRKEPEGISLTFPSRVERVVTEMLMRRLLSARARTQMTECLMDYRSRLDADALYFMVKLYSQMNALMFVSDLEQPPVLPSIDPNNPPKSLPAWLIGPSPNYDLLRYFIKKTIDKLFERIFASAMEEIQSPATQEELEDLHDEDGCGHAMTLLGDNLRRFGQAFLKFNEELRGELEFFPSAWGRLLPGNQHALIVMCTARHLIINAIKTLVNYNHWLSDDIPPHGDLVLQGVAQFERLCREVTLVTEAHGFLDQENLLAALETGITSALMKRFRNVEDVLLRCMKSETWQPIQPPTELHSVAAVDLFSFTNAIFDAVCDLNAPLEWVLPSFLQFLSRLSQEYAEFVVSSCQDTHLLAVVALSQSVMDNLLNPMPREDSDEEARQHKKGKKGKGLLGILGMKKDKSSKGDPDAQTATVVVDSKTQAPAEPTQFFDDLDLHPNAVKLGPAPSHATLHMHSGEDLNWNPTQKANARSRKKKTKKDVEEVVPEVEEMRKRFGNHTSTLVNGVQKAFAGTPLPTMLVRLYNLMFFCEQLPNLGRKFLRLAVEQSELRDPNWTKIHRSMDQAASSKTQKVRTTERDMHTVAGFGISDTEIQKMQELLQEVIVQCRQHLVLKARDVCALIASRIVYADLGQDIFLDMYPASDFGSQTFAAIIQNLKSTVLKFVNQVPSIFQLDLLTFVLHELVKAWMLMLVQMGYEGHVFYEHEIRVVDQDMQCLEDFAEKNNLVQDMDIRPHDDRDQTRGAGLLSKFRGQEAGEDREPTSVNIFEHITDFLVMLREEPYILAQLNEKFDMDKERKRLEAAEKKTAQQTTALDNNNMFQELQQPAAQDMHFVRHLSEKKSTKKGIFGGVMKFGKKK